MKLKPYSPVTTVRKAFRLLEVLGEKQPARPSELANQLKLSRSNVHRLLATLKDMGCVERLSNGTYCLGIKLFLLGNTVVYRNRLADMVRPFLTHLAEISQENVNLGIMHEQKVLYIDKIESPHYLKLDKPIGKTDPIYCTALGKALLSGLTDDELETFLRNSKLVPYTKKTIRDPETLTREIRKVRKQGYAVDVEELSDGIRCIAVPILDYTNKVIAAISISAPSLRLTRQKMKELKNPLIEATAEASKKFRTLDKGA